MLINSHEAVHNFFIEFVRAGRETATLSQLDTVLEGEAVNGGEGGDFVDGGDFVISED